MYHTLEGFTVVDPEAWVLAKKYEICTPTKSHDLCDHFLKEMENTSLILWSHLYPCFGLLVMSALGFKARVDPSLVCFLACMQWTPQIHLWCNTC